MSKVCMVYSIAYLCSGMKCYPSKYNPLAINYSYLDLLYGGNAVRYNDDIIRARKNGWFVFNYRKGVLSISPKLSQRERLNCCVMVWNNDYKTHNFAFCNMIMNMAKSLNVKVDLKS